MAKKKREKHICSECIGEFDGKDVYVADVPNAMIPHSTVYCLKCIKKLGIDDYKPYLKPIDRKDVIKISVVRSWLKEFDDKNKIKLINKYFSNKNIDSLTTKELRELYKNEVINKK